MDSAATTLSAAGQDESSYLAESAAPEAESSWTDEHGATWTYRKSISGDAIVLTGLSNKSEFAGADVLVPDEIDGLPVTRISGEGALADTNAKSVTFPATLTNIDDQSGTFFNNMVQSSPQGKIFFLGGCPTVPSGDWSKVTTVTIGREGVIYAVGGQDAWVSAGAPFGAYVGNYIAPESVSLENTSVSIPAGGRATLSASVLPARDSYYSAHNSIFWYSDSSILDVDGSTGLVKVSSSATVGDTATVIAQNGTGLEATCTVTVAEAPTAIDISDCTVSPSTYPDVYYNNGSPKLPQITVTSPSGETLEEGLDYTLTYTDSSNNAVDSPTEIGSYTATITGILPYYTGTKTMSFSITAERQPILGWSYTVDSNGEATITGYTGEEATTLVVPGSIDGAKVTTVSSLGSASATTIVIPDCVTTIGDLSGATASTVRFLGDLPTGASASTLPSGASVERFDAYSSSYADFTGATAPTVLWKYYYDLELDGSSTGVLGSAVEATSSTPVPTGCQMASDAELDFTLPTQIDGVDLSVIGERALGSDSKIDFNIVRVPACYKTVDSECFLNLDAIVHFYSTPPAKIGDSAIGVTSGTLDPWLEIFYPEDYESEWEEWATANSVDLRGGFDMNYTATIGYKDGHVGETAYRKAYITAYNGLLGATFDSSDVGTFYYQIFYGFKNSNIDGTNLTSLILENTTYSDGSVSGACEFYGTAFKNLTCDITFLGAPPTSDNYAEAFKGVDGAAYTGTIYVEQEYLSQWQSSEWANYYTIEMKSDSDPTHFTYTDNGDGTYTVTGYTGDSDSITVPGNLDNVVIDGVTYNGIVTKVGNSAFESDSSKNTYYKLRTVVLPDTIINIGNSAFENTNLTYIDLGNGVETMGNRVFWGCRYLTSIELPASLKSLGFTPWCASSITDFTVEEGSQYYDDIDGVLYSANHDVLVAYPLARTDSTYTVDPSTKVIGEAAFRGAYGYYGDLKEIVLPDGLMEIQDYAFQQMDGLETINIPDSVTKIGVYTFQSASDLKSINFPKACTKVPDGFIQFCDSITSVELHEDVTEIGEEAFSFCSNLTSVSLNEGLVKIGDYAFLDASKLPEVEIPSTVETIGSGAFEGCSSIKELDITGANVTTIGSAAFSGMSSLKSFVIPSTVTSIGSYMFSSDYKLKSVTFEEPVQITTIPEACFNACYGLETVTI
ncbi:MAG: leucine-rich repeat protein, partial [Coriobacteriales bacterium]